MEFFSQCGKGVHLSQDLLKNLASDAQGYSRRFLKRGIGLRKPDTPTGMTACLSYRACASDGSQAHAVQDGLESNGKDVCGRHDSAGIHCDGEPAKNSPYDTHLYKLCDEAGIKRFCMHALGHAYAT